MLLACQYAVVCLCWSQCCWPVIDAGRCCSPHMHTDISFPSESLKAEACGKPVITGWMLKKRPQCPPHYLIRSHTDMTARSELTRLQLGWCVFSGQRWAAMKRIQRGGTWRGGRWWAQEANERNMGTKGEGWRLKHHRLEPKVTKWTT